MKNLVWKQPGNMFKQQHNHALEMSDYPFQCLFCILKNWALLKKPSCFKIATTPMNNKIFGITLVLNSDVYSFMRARECNQMIDTTNTPPPPTDSESQLELVFNLLL